MNGSGLRGLRKQQGIRVAELADMVGVHRATINRWEDATEDLSPATAMACQSVLGDPQIVAGVIAKRLARRVERRLRAKNISVDNA